MYKYLVLGVVLSLQLSGIMGRSLVEDEGKPYYVVGDTDKNEGVSMGIGPNQLVVYGPIRPNAADDSSKELRNNLDSLAKGLSAIISDSAHNNPTKLTNNMNTVEKQLSSEYLVTKGIGAHKLHLRKLSWNKARKVCIDEGGQLADIRSDSEEKIVLRLMVEDSVESAWIGYHDIFEEGDWVSVLGEPLGKSGWDRWWKGHLPNPDNQDGDEDCACLMKDGGGMNDNRCSREMAFVCKITEL